MQESLKCEVNLLQRIQSQHVIKLNDIEKINGTLYMFMQYCNGGDLDNLLQLRSRFTEDEAHYIIA